jgi:tetratricopeptide (TPR) repeat protein
MSLLLDALKEAEHFKRNPRGAAGPLPHAAQVEQGASRHGTLSLEEDSVPVAPPAPEPAAAVRNPRLAELTRPQTVRAAIPASTGNKRMGWLVGLLGAIVLLLGGSYYYLTRVNQSLSPAMVPQTAVTTTLPAETPPPTQHILPPVVFVPQAPEARAPDEPAVARVRSAAPAAIATTLPAASARPIVVIGSTSAPPLQSAHAALQAGDLARARTLYEQVLVSDAGQPDAHLGLALIAQSQQDRDPAVRHFRAVLAVSPDQPRAWSGLAELASDGELPALESKLRGLLAARPDAALNFALGNNLMRQSRWAEAQEQYFAATTAAPENAEYRFNLAVALDRLGKHAAAATHYRNALQLAEGHPVQFDVAAVRTRLAALPVEAP